VELALNEERFKDLCLAVDFVCRKWRGMSEASRPGGVWIALHAALEADANEVDPAVSPVCAAWFLDERGLHPRTAQEFLRFDTVVNRRPWSSAPLRPSDPPPSRFFGIGVSRVAPYREGRDFYVDVLYGPLYGAGWRLRGDVPSKDLWRA
jgi:hypothetical protein